MIHTRQISGGVFAVGGMLGILFAAAVRGQAQTPLSTSPTTPPAPANSSAIDALQQDARLDTVVTLDKTAVSLDDLTKGLSRKGLLLFAGRNCENQRVHVRLNKRPLRDLMRALAELLPGEWKPRDGKSGYILIMNPAAVTYRERWQRLHQEDRAHSYDVMRAQMLTAMRGPGESYYAAPNPLSSEDERSVYERGRTDFAMFHSLPADLQDKIAANINDIAIDTGQFSGDISEGSVSVPLVDLPAAFRDAINSDLTAHDSQSNMGPSGVTVRFYNIGYMACMGLQMANGRMVYSNHCTPCIPSREVPALRGNYEFAARMKGAAAPAEWKELAAYETSHVWKNDKPLHPFPPVWSSTRRDDLLAGVAKRAGIEYVSDCYADTRGLSDAARGLPPAMLPPENSDAKELLNEIAAAHDVSWKQGSKNIYLLRNNRWYSDDFYEAPAPLLKAWLSRWRTNTDKQEAAYASHVADLNAPPAALTVSQKRALIEQRAEISGSLTVRQISVGFQYASVDTVETTPNLPPRRVAVYPFVRLANRLLRERGAARFFERLTSRERDLLAQGQLAFAALAPAVQNEAARLLPGAVERARKAPAYLGVEPTIDNVSSSSVSTKNAIDPGPGLRLIISTEPKSQTDR